MTIVVAQPEVAPKVAARDRQPTASRPIPARKAKEAKMEKLFEHKMEDLLRYFQHSELEGTQLHPNMKPDECAKVFMGNFRPTDRAVSFMNEGIIRAPYPTPLALIRAFHQNLTPDEVRAAIKGKAIGEEVGLFLSIPDVREYYLLRPTKYPDSNSFIVVLANERVFLWERHGQIGYIAHQLTWDQALHSTVNLMKNLAPENTGTTLHAMFVDIARETTKRLMAESESSFNQAVAISKDGRKIVCADLVGVYDQQGLKSYPAKYFQEHKVLLSMEHYNSDRDLSSFLGDMLDPTRNRTSKRVQQHHSFRWHEEDGTYTGKEKSIFLTPRRYCQSVPTTP